MKIRSMFFFVILISVTVCLPLSAQEPSTDVRELVFGVKIERTVICQELHNYAFELKRGQVVKVNIAEKGADVLAVVSQTGDIRKVSAIANSGTGFMRESLTVIAEADGVYWLEIRAEKVSDSSGKYELTATLGNTATLGDKQRFEAEKLLEEASAVLVNNDTGKFPTALANLEKALKIRQNLADVYSEAITKMFLGNYYLKLQDFTKAEAYFIQALALFDKISNKAEIGYVNTTLGTLYALGKNELKARKYINDGIDTLNTIGDKRSEQAFNMLKLRAFSEIFSSDGETIKIPDLDKELNEAKRTNDEAAQLKIWTKAVWANAMDDGQTEFYEFQKTLPVLDFENNQVKRQNKEAEINKKSLALLKRVEEQALPLAQKLKDKHSEAQTLIALGFAYSNLEGDSGSSENEEDEEAKDDISAKKAKTYLVQGLALSKISNDKFLESFAYVGLSGVYMDNDEVKLSIYFAKKSISSIQNLRQNLKNFADKESQQLLARIYEPMYQEMTGLLADEGRPAEAIQILNLGRDQEFFDFKLIDCQSPAQVNLTINEKKGEEKFQTVLNGTISKYRINPNLTNEAVSAEVNDVLAKLEKDFDDETDSEDDKIKNLKDVGDMQEALRTLSKSTGKKHVTIYYSVHDDGSSILLITPENIKSFSGSSSEALTDSKAGLIVAQENSRGVGSPAAGKSSEPDIYDKFLNFLNNPGYDPRPLGSKIYQQLFKAVDDNEVSNTLESELEKYKAEVIHWSLSGNIRSIPIAALYDENSARYLVEKFENVVFTRAGKDRFLTDQKPWKNGIGFGTTLAIKGFPRTELPMADDELFSIFGNPAASQAGFYQGKFFLDEDYTRGAFLSIPAFKPDFVHIAAHFYFQPGDASGSFLPLVDGSKISLADLQQAGKLFDGVDLLTLSACETAAVKSDDAGKEVDGLAELSQRLGAKSVIATLWKVSDNGTSKLMSEFYRIKKGTPELSKSEVLREAQLRLLNGKNSWEKGYQMRRESFRRVRVKLTQTSQSIPEFEFRAVTGAEFEHPYYWAPFVIYGSSNGKGTSDYIDSKPSPVLNETIAGNSNSTRVSGLSTADFIGNWEGLFDVDQYQCSLIIERFEGDIFYGKLKPKDAIIEVMGKVDLTTKEILILETKVAYSGSVQSWTLGTNRGTISNDGKFISGSGSAGTVSYKWSFSKVSGGQSSFDNFPQVTPNSTNSLSQTNPFTLKEIESAFQAKLYDDVIRKARIFIQYEPENKDALSYLGYSLLIRNSIDEGVIHLAKAVKLGQQVPFFLKRGRSNPILGLGQLLVDSQIIVSNDGIVITDGGKQFQAPYSSLSTANLENYGGTCPVAFFQGAFIETRAKSDKVKADNKEFALFPQAASLVPVRQGNLTLYQISCYDQGLFSTAVIKLIAALRSQ